MSPFRLLTLLAAIVLAFGFAACGDDDGNGEATTPAETTEANGDAAAGNGGEEGEPAGDGGEATTLDITAEPDGSLAYTEEQLSVPAGNVTVEFDNPASIQHDVAFADPSGEMIGKTETITDDSDTLQLSDLEPGEYEYWCTVPGHREAGMEGVLTVE